MSVIGGDAGAKQRHAVAVARTDAATDRLLRSVADELAAAVAAIGDRPLRNSDLPRLERAVDSAVGAIYGRRYDGPSGLGAIIDREAARTASIEVEAVCVPLETMLKRSDPQLLAVMHAHAERE